MLHELLRVLKKFFSHICNDISSLVIMRMRMRCSKAKLIAVLLIFSVIVGLELYLSRSKGAGQSAGQFSTEWRSVEKPHETWISELKGLAVKNSGDSSVQRIQSVKHVCGNTRKSWDSLSVTEKQILAKHIIVNDEHKFLFCSVPKVACSNWKRVLMVLDGEATDSNAIRRVNHKGFTFLEDLPPLAIKRKLKEYHKFMFVREPLARLLSAYKDKFMLNNTSFHKSYGRKIVKKVRKNAHANSKGDDVTLKEFLQYITESHVEDMNEHWMPFYELCQPCVVSYDFIGSFENLEADANQVLKKLNVDEQVSFPRQQKYYQEGGKGYAPKKITAKDVSSKLLTKVLRKYAKDYDMFSYPRPEV